MSRNPSLFSSVRLFSNFPNQFSQPGDFILITDTPQIFIETSLKNVLFRLDVTNHCDTQKSQFNECFALPLACRFWTCLHIKLQIQPVVQSFKKSWISYSHIPCFLRKCLFQNTGHAGMYYAKDCVYPVPCDEWPRAFCKRGTGVPSSLQYSRVSVK